MFPIVTTPKSQEQFRHAIQLDAIADHLTDGEINEIASNLGHTWRDRQLPPGVTVRSCVHRALNADHSIAAMLADLAAIDDPDAPVPTDSAWCQARSRMPLMVLQELIIRRARECQRRFGQPYQWHGRPVFIADGSTVSMPDEPELVEAFGYAPTRHGPSRFPVGRITFIELAGLEAIWDYRLDDYRTSEDEQFEEMWPSLPYGCIILADKKFGSFYTLAKLRQRRIGVITLLHQRRNPYKLIRKGRQLGPNEWLVHLDLAPQSRRKYNDPTLPQLLSVRLIRVRFHRGGRRHTLWVVTTLMDTALYPSRQVAAGYRWRWDIEPRIGSLKTTLEMNVLRSKKPGSVRREVASIVLGHNLVWMLIHEAAESNGVPAGDISFACAVKIAVAFSQALPLAAASQRPALREKMLKMIASQVNHHPFDRAEPRKVKRDRRRYPYLKEPRAVARAKCLT
jgi:hypothetical protein